MPARIVNGRVMAEEICQEVAREAEELKRQLGREVGLGVVLVGENPASLTYVRMKRKRCEQLGIRSFLVHLPEGASQKEVVSAVRQFNRDEKVDGILVQMPLPKGLNPVEVASEIALEKDVDGLNPATLGKLMAEPEGMDLRNADLLLPCTPLGVMEILWRHGVEIKGKRACVVGCSPIVGRPLALMLMHEFATVTMCHIHTRNLKHHTLDAEILVSATGVPHLIKADMVREGAIVIDVGISKVGEKIVGDVDFEAVKEKASLITPVPGGVGPLTIAMLMRNTVKAARRRMQGGG